MKKNLLILLLLPFVSLAQKLTLTGNIKGLADGSKVVLTNLQDPGSELAKTTSKAGAFTLRATLEAPTLLGLAVGDKFKTAVFLGTENVKVIGNTNQKADNWKFTGSKSQNDFTEFQNTFIPHFEKLNQYAADAQMGSDSAKLALDNEISLIQNEADSFITKHSASPVSPLVILTTMSLSDDVEIAEKRANKLTESAMNTVLGGQLKQAIIDARFNSIGSIAPDFSQADTTGKMVSLVQFRGKYVLVDFWASWCGPCRRENPNVVKLFNKFKDKNFTVLGVSLDEDKNSWLQAIEKDKLSWTQVSDLKGWTNAVAQQYKITAIPRNLLIDPYGKIIAKDLRGSDLELKLCQILGCD